MEETLIFIDEGFLSKLSKYFGEGKYIKIDYIKFANSLVKKQNLSCKHIFYYTAPPFQQTIPTKEERKRKEGYDKFIAKLSKNINITIREGRVQRLKFNNDFKYKQKGVDTLMTIDLSHIREDSPNIKKLIIVTSDTDFCPIIKDLEKRNIEVILYTYFDRKRNSPFSISNELLNCCSKYVQLIKQDFEDSILEK